MVTQVLSTEARKHGIGAKRKAKAHLLIIHEILDLQGRFGMAFGSTWSQKRTPSTAVTVLSCKRRLRNQLELKDAGSHPSLLPTVPWHWHVQFSLQAVCGRWTPVASAEASFECPVKRPLATSLRLSGAHLPRGAGGMLCVALATVPSGRLTSTYSSWQVSCTNVASQETKPKCHPLRAFAEVIQLIHIVSAHETPGIGSTKTRNNFNGCTPASNLHSLYINLRGRFETLHSKELGLIVFLIAIAKISAEPMKQD